MSEIEHEDERKGVDGMEGIDWTKRVDPLKLVGLGVAGNFAGHLEQAGEASDFVDVQAAAGAPKGIFPFYVPDENPDEAASSAAPHFLHRYPVSSQTLRLGSLDEKHQIEPEIALLVELEYEGAGEQRRVQGLRPLCAMAHNDCSIRREGARKISEKKNWGPDSKGTASLGIPIDRFTEGGILDSFRLASFLLRDGQLHAYGLDSPLAGARGYSYFYARLASWIVEKLREQRDSGPLEDLPRWLRIAGFPRHALISVGATRYTEFGESTFLEVGDRIVVALYDAGAFDADAIAAVARGERSPRATGLSVLFQDVVGP